MCGIVGVLKRSQACKADALLLRRMADALRHRGPDEFGYHEESAILLGHRRLSIIDLETGKQPVYNEDESICIIFNGEIFNFQEIRPELERLGHRFRTRSDTEVIVHAYEEWGYDCLHKLRGMFAFALWDKRRNTLFLARDRIGIKPLFYSLEETRLSFASEIKALLELPGLSGEIDTDAQYAFFSLSYIPAPLTIFQNIRKLPAGHYLIVEDNKVAIRQYWDLRFQPNYGKSEKQFAEEFLQEFDEAVRLRMISDVPVGAFLSGGVDSGSVVAAMSRQTDEPVRTFCMGFGGTVGGYFDERPLASQIARRYGTQHCDHEVNPEIGAVIGEIVHAFDEPFADHSTIPTYYLCQITRRAVKVALSGLGGDELFAGYERYLGMRLSTLYGLLPSGLREGALRPLVEHLPERADGHYTVNHLKRFVRAASLPADERYLGFLSRLGQGRYQGLFTDPKALGRARETCHELVLRYFNAEAGGEDLLDRALYCDIKTYLPEDILACTDRLSMRHSLEVRVPMVDHRLMEFCATIPSRLKIRFREKKFLLRKAVGHRLPPEVLRHRKQGFVGPMATWLQTDLRPFVACLLDRRNLERHGLFDPAVVGRILDDHFSRRENNDKLIWSLVMFQAWYDLYIENAPQEMALEGTYY